VAGIQIVSRSDVGVAILEGGFQRQSVVLPKQSKIEVAQEGVAVADGWVSFLPEDLGTSNLIYRTTVADLMGFATRN
jgi:hypothetical protein